jgi:sigma-54 dependent transcriptional regulator, flagellar regulatory protein
MVMAKTRSSGIAAPRAIIGASAAVAHLRDVIARVAPSDAAVLVSGASGTGKELVARAIHDASYRANKPYVAINCGAIPHDLIESELFGHEKGSFTGAQSRRIGRFEEANGGTLFLDEIGDMRFDMQVKLLRVLEEGVITRVGGNTPIAVDVRIISATHRNIEDAIHDGRFREDLYFRLGVVPVAVPDLKDRPDDIAALIAHFQAAKPQPMRTRFSDAAMARLFAHAWPGNVRELRNVVERAAILFGGATIDATAVETLFGKSGVTITDGQALRTAALQVAPTAPLAAPEPLPEVLPSGKMPIDLKAMLETMELERIQMALDMADGIISEAARLLTLKRTTLIEKMRKYGVDKLC